MMSSVYGVAFASIVETTILDSVPTSRDTPSPASTSSHQNIGAIIGGGIDGVVDFVALGFIELSILRQ